MTTATKAAPAKQTAAVVVPEYIYVPALLTFDYSIDTIGPVFSDACEANEWLDIEISGRRSEVFPRVARLPLGDLRQRIAEVLTAH